MQNFETPVHPDDNDAEHMAVHLAAAKQGDHNGKFQMHIMAHQMQMQAKAQAQQQQAGGQPGLPGTPGGAGPARPAPRSRARSRPTQIC